MLRITEALAEPAISQVRTLLQDYATYPGVVACLQDFEGELASLPGVYGPPTGRLLLALRQRARSERRAYRMRRITQTGRRNL